MTANNVGATLLVFPGSSLMDLTLLAPGVILIRCPGCGAVKVLAVHACRDAGLFYHEDDSCPVLLRVEAALDQIFVAQAAPGH
jgi:hypothetical protein